MKNGSFASRVSDVRSMKGADNSASAGGRSQPETARAAALPKRTVRPHDPLVASVILEVHAVPNAKVSQVAGLHGTAVRIRLAAPPADGRANAELLSFLATQLGLPNRNVTLAGGASSRAKRVAIQGLPIEEIRSRLGLAPAG